MEIWLNWLVGFFIWFFIIVLFALITFLITEFSDKKGAIRGKIPDEVFNYKYKTDILPKGGFFLDTHSHTIASDGWMTAEQNIKWHIANGFNAFVLTDHNTGKNNEEMMKLQDKYPEIILIPGFEWTTARLHLNFLGIMDFPDRVPINPSDEQIESAIHKAKELGAIVQVDHITWTQDQPLLRSKKFTHPTREQLLEWGVDGFEINNEMRWYDPKTVYWLDRLKAENKLKRPIYISTGTDIHNPIREWATGWTEILLTEEERKNANWDVIKKALSEARTKIWVDHDYFQTNESKILMIDENSNKKELFAPFFGLRYGIEKVPGTLKGIISYVLWFLLAYFPLRLIIHLITLI